VNLRDLVAAALDEDLAPLGDLTASLLPEGAVVSAAIVPRSDGVLSGVDAAAETFRQVSDLIVCDWTVVDGAPLVAGEPIASVVGPLAAVLTAERTALNFLGHLSGIATLTRRYVDAAAGTAARIRDTRKTTPGLRTLEKAAVRAGGGVNHRGNLSDGILVKDNHLAGMSIEEAVAAARRMWPGRTVQVECDDLDQLNRALAAATDLVLLDNMSPDAVRDAVALVNHRCLVEVSGGVTLDTVAEYAATGADLISIGALTHSAPVLDIGLDLA
jgi:nicotinate-nucleotide pyrophosphorylase (carboxylating)